MNLDRVTITGADDSVEPEAIVDLSMRFPWVEWGILVSKNQEGSPRFPSQSWRERLQLRTRGMPIQLSLHVCGRWLRNLLIGQNDLPIGMTEGFQRMQLNFHAEKLEYDAIALARALADMSVGEMIFQIDGASGQEILAAVHGEGRHSFDQVPLFDCSHGAGVLPDEWPAPFDLSTYHGYAGGLGPDNLAEQIPLIGKAAGDTRIWLDMESRVRSDDGRSFDLAKVERCLQIAEPFIRRPE